jgi:hypothetical protein
MMGESRGKSNGLFSRLRAHPVAHWRSSLQRPNFALEPTPNSLRSCLGLPLPCFFHGYGYRPFIGISAAPLFAHSPPPTGYELVEMGKVGIFLPGIWDWFVWVR